MNDKLLVIYVTCPVGEGGKLAEVLVTGKLAACVNVVPIKSFYTWKGELCRDGEELLIIKSRREIYPELEKQLKKVHPYEMPEIVAVSAESVEKDYLDWVFEQTRGPENKND